MNLCLKLQQGATRGGEKSLESSSLADSTAAAISGCIKETPGTLDALYIFFTIFTSFAWKHETS